MACTSPLQFRGPDGATLSIFDLRGRLVRTVVESDFPQGVHWVHWDGRTKDGEPVQSGIYLYQLRVGEETLRGRAMLLH